MATPAESSHSRIHKPVTDWLETLPHSRPYIQTEYVREINIGHRGLIEMERNDLWF